MICPISVRMPSRTTSRAWRPMRTIVAQQQEGDGGRPDLLGGYSGGPCWAVDGRCRSARTTDDLRSACQIVGPQYARLSTIAFAKLLRVRIIELRTATGLRLRGSMSQATIDLRSTIRSIPIFPSTASCLRHLDLLAHDTAGTRADSNAWPTRLSLKSPITLAGIESRGLSCWRTLAWHSAPASCLCASRASCPAPRCATHMRWSTATPRSRPEDAIKKGARARFVDDLLADGGHHGGGG